MPRLPPLLLLRIVAPHFVAGLELAGCEVAGGFVVRSAPIVKYLCGWTRDAVQAYCRRKGWACEVVDELQPVPR